MASRKPFSRQRVERGQTPDEWEFARAAEFAADAYGWGPDYLERLTSEQLVLYLDAAQDRLTHDIDARFSEAVEAVRVGTIIAQDAKAYRRWRSRRPAGSSTSRGGGLKGMALERAIAGFAARNPEYVVTGAA